MNVEYTIGYVHEILSQIVKQTVYAWLWEWIELSRKYMDLVFNICETTQQ